MNTNDPRRFPPRGPFVFCAGLHGSQHQPNRHITRDVDPFGTVFEHYSHNYELTYRNARAPNQMADIHNDEAVGHYGINAVMRCAKHEGPVRAVRLAPFRQTG